MYTIYIDRMIFNIVDTTQINWYHPKKGVTIVKDSYR